MSRPEQPGFVGKLVSVVIGAVLLVLGFMFSVVLLAVVFVVGLAVWAWFWWKTRKLREQLRANPPPYAEREQQQGDGHVIEGEAVIVAEETTQVTSNRLPESPDRRSPD